MEGIRFRLMGEGNIKAQYGCIGRYEYRRDLPDDLGKESLPHQNTK
jgi:hypothetical protein